MLIRALGGIDIEPPGATQQPVQGRRPRLILALLASRGGALVSDEVIAEAIWGDSPPASSRTAIQTYVSALRDQLEPERARRSSGSHIINEAGAYRLAADVDVAQFEVLIDEAAERHRHDPQQAMASLDRALALWSDPPLGEFCDEPWAVGTLARLRERHATAIEARVGLALDDDRGDEVLAILRESVEIYPYRERLAGQLMLLHYRRGDQQRALATFTAIRARLSDDLGLEPGRELQLLERAILEQDPSLLRRTQQRLDERTRASPTADDGLPPSRQLTGRDHDVRAVIDLVTTTRHVTISGPGGVGKSSLAVKVARDVQREFGLRIVYVDLARHQSRSVWRAVGAELRVVEHPLAPLEATVADTLAETPTLLVMETCELAPGEVADVAARLDAVTGLRILLTSQVPVGSYAEHVHRLEGLELDAAVDLLAATLKRHGERVDRSILSEIAQRLGRLPLGLEMAAARLPALGAVELLGQLGRDSAVLVGGNDRPERQRSVSAAASWSIGLLDDEAHDVLAGLAAFSAPFTLAMAAAVVGSGESGTADAASGAAAPDAPKASLSTTLGELVDRSLVERRGGDTGAPRFRLPDGVAVAVSRSRPDVMAAAKVKLADVVFDLAQRDVAGRARPPTSVLAGSAVVATMDDFGPEVLPALASLDARDDARCVLLAGLLGSYFQAHGLVSEGREWLTRAITRYADAPPMVVVSAAAQAGFLAWYEGDSRECERLLDQIVARVGDVPLPGFADTVLGCRAFSQGKHDDAADHLDAATAAIGGTSRQRLLLDHLAGNTNWYAGRLDRAIEHYRHHRLVAEDAGDDFHDAQSRRFEAMLLAFRHRTDPLRGVEDDALERAWRLAERSRVMAQRMADPMSGSQSSAALAALGFTVGDTVEASRDAARAVQLSRRQFDVFALRTVLPILAAARLGDDPERAAQLLGWYLDLLDRTGQGHSMAAADIAESVLEQCRSELGGVEFAKASAVGAARSIAELGDFVSDTL